MNESLAQDAAFVVIGFLVIVGPIILVIPIVVKRNKILGAAYQGAKKVGTNAAKAVGKLGKKAALNTTTGQRLQQEFAQRKAANVRRGQEAYLREGPMFGKFMTAGQKEIYNRDLDKQRHAKRAEDIKNINDGLTGNVASAIGRGDDIGGMLSSLENPANRGKKFRWADGREVADEDIASLRKLNKQGFIGSNGQAKKDTLLATAAMQQIFANELAGKQNIEGVSSMLEGASAEENQAYSVALREAAGAKKYKNFAGATVSNGHVDQFYAKTGESELNPDGSSKIALNPKTGAPKGYDERGNLIDVKLDGAMKVVSSGLRGLNKDALDKTHDDIMLRALEVTYNNHVNAQGKVDDAARQQRYDFIVKTADETKDIDKKFVLDQVAERLGVDKGVFAEIQRSLKSGGAVDMPRTFTVNSVSGKQNPKPQSANPPAPVVVQTPPQVLPPAGTLNIPHGGQPAPGGTPAPVQTMPPPLPRPQPQPGNRPRFNNRPPGPSGPSGPGSSGPGSSGPAGP